MQIKKKKHVSRNLVTLVKFDISLYIKSESKARHTLSEGNSDSLIKQVKSHLTVEMILDFRRNHHLSGPEVGQSH